MVVSAIASFTTRTLKTIFREAGISLADDGPVVKHRQPRVICLLFLAIAAWDHSFKQSNLTVLDLGGGARNFLHVALEVCQFVPDYLAG